MKKKIFKWLAGVLVAGIALIFLLVVIVLNPTILYANETRHNNFTIYHNEAIDGSLISSLDEAENLVSKSEFYRPEITLDICLNDGNQLYPTLIQKLRGKAFAWGFYDKVVMQGNADYPGNFVELNGYKWNMTQLFAHEMVHCIQFDHLGLWRSNPIAKIPDWKWEGYAEYMVRHQDDQKDLYLNLSRFNQTPAEQWDIVFRDKTIAPRDYYEYWTLVQYAMDIKKMTYTDMLKENVSEASVRKEMNRWYNLQSN